MSLFRFLTSLCVLLFAAASQAQTTFVRDSFTGTGFLESHSPDTGGAWTRVRGAGLVLQSDTLRPNKTTEFDAYTNAATPPSAEYVVGMTVTLNTNFVENYAELYARRSGTTYYVIYFDAHDNYSLRRVVSGVSTTLASGVTTATNALGTPNEFVFSVTNAQKRLILNGTVVATSTDNTITAAGVVGLGLSEKTNNDAVGDDFYASSLAPTAVEMDSMSATRDGQRALISWTTGRQSHNLGYRVWRDGVCLTRTPIAGSTFFVNTPALASGTSYRWIDNAATANATYWIEELDVRGTREWHGPIVANAGTIDARTVPTPKLSELTRDVRTRPSRFIANVQEPIIEDTQRNFDLARRDALKIAVTTRGIQEAPLPANVDVNRLRVWEDGREIPIATTATTLRFYGMPLDTPMSGTRVYWLTWDDEGAGARIAIEPVSNTPILDASGFLATVERRDKMIFDATLVSDQGDGFFGPVITDDVTYPAKQALRLESIDRTATSAELAITLQGATEVAHRVAVSLNDIAIGSIEFDGREKKHATLTVDASLLRDGENEVVLVAKNGAEDVSAVEAVRVTYARRYVAADGTLLFTAPSGTLVRVEGLDANAIALDITNPATPVQLAIDGDVVSIAGTGTRTILATSAFASPAIDANTPSALHELQPGEVVMIAPRALHEALAPLATLRGGVIAAVEDIYDEYSFGAKDANAIRAFLAGVRPRAVLLAGDGSYDPRDYVGGAALDLIPVHFVESAMQRTPFDAWYTDFDDDGVADIAIGRLPARDAAELSAMVAKIIAYEHDVAPSRDVVYVRGTAGFASHLATLATTDIDIEEEGVVAARENLLQRWTTGAGVIDFSGHGSVAMWATGGFFTSADAQSLTNAHLPLVIAMTCLNGYFHDLSQDSLAEELVRNPSGGAAAVWAFSTLTETAGQLDANHALLAALASGKSLGDATRAAQRATVDPDVRRTLILFGDPLMKMNGRDVRRRAVR
ncbi:MAG TPA: C25 family cysteine peptidase [Thermoanaerobaculia bacterium]